jgi:hypothetical protein
VHRESSVSPSLSEGPHPEEACTVVSDRIHRCEEPLEDAGSTPIEYPIEYQPTAVAR